MKTGKTSSKNLHSKARLEAICQSIAEGIITIDDQRRITYLNKGAERITGWSCDEVLGMPINEVLQVSKGGKKFLDLLPEISSLQVNVLSREQRLVSIAVTITDLNPPLGDAKERLLLFRDITDEESTQHLQSIFLASITHEFRTPLSALSASVEFLLDEMERLKKEDLQELLRSIHLSVTGLQTLIDNLLESINIEAGRFTIRLRPIEFGEVIAEAVGVIQPLLNRRQQRLLINKPRQTPHVNADSTRLKQVFVNLLSNASKYGPIGQTIRLSVALADGDKVRVEVADRGPGVPPDEQGKLFQRFSRLSNRDGSQHGIGLGLSVVKTIIEDHGGMVGMTERPGGGSIFWFTVPIVPEGIE